MQCYPSVYLRAEPTPQFPTGSACHFSQCVLDCPQGGQFVLPDMREMDHEDSKEGGAKAHPYV